MRIIVRRRLGLFSAVVTLTVVCGLLALTASSALAVSPCATCTPWWHLTSAARPTVLQPGGSADTVVKLAVSATGGEMAIENYKRFRDTESAESRVVVPFDASRAVMQETFEKLYPSRKLEVTGGPGDEKGSKPYEIRFPGQYFSVTELSVKTENGAKGLSCEGALEPPSCGGGIEEEGKKVGSGTVSTVTQREGRPDGQIVVLASNLGDGPVLAEQNPVTIADALPAGLTAVSIEAIAGKNGGDERGPVSCQLASLSCSFSHGCPRVVVRCHPPEGLLPPFQPIEVVIGVEVTGAVSAPNEASVSGGGAPAVSVSRPVSAGGSPAVFGVEDYGLSLEDQGGAVDTQAGSHPFQATFSVALNQTLRHSAGYPLKFKGIEEEGEKEVQEEGTESLLPQPVSLAKDLALKLPPGLIGNPTVFPRCQTAELTANTSTCPQSSAVGVAQVAAAFPHGPLDYTNFTVPLFNMAPAPGEPARFGFKISSTTVFIDTSVRTGGDYGVTTTVSNINQEVALISSQVTVWGVPGDPVHDLVRGSGCIEESEHPEETLNGQAHPCIPSAEPHPEPLLSLPRSCTGPLQSSIQADSWEAPQNLVTVPSDPMQALDGCNRLPFTPEVSVTPDSGAASSPTGLKVNVHVPQQATLNPTGLSEGDPRDITVTLPEGVAVNPASADGLVACTGDPGALPGGALGSSGDQAGFTGLNGSIAPGSLTATFTEYFPGSTNALGAGFEEPFQQGVNFCPDASKIGEVSIRTPILPHPVEGFVYLASQNANPFGGLVALYVIAEDPVSGVVIKLAGNVHLSPSGQVVTTFEDSPQAPFEDAEFHFFGGERAPLASPSRCGAYTTTASFTSWASSEPVNASSTFNITSGPNGSPCPGASLPFSPSLTGGATNVNAGAFSPFTLTMTRKDGEQNLQSVEAKLPPGLSGILAGVELCPEPLADQGECGEGSKIGETTVSVGVGGEPFTVSGGRFFLTGPYNGTGSCTVGTPGCAPFGITFEVPAKAGPFDLERNTANPAGEDACDCVVVRGKIEIDPYTAALTIVSDSPGSPYAIPTSIEGIPLEIQHVNATTTRSSFQFNPTSCNKTAVTGTIHSSEGATSTIDIPFQVTNCAALKFAPKLAVTTSGKTSKAKGASLKVKLTYPKAPIGTYANIARVKVDLPKQLPSQLKTLQKACTAKQFELNPANCPKESKVGYAKAITPLLPVPLEGPAIFVSHGNEAFPTLTMVLQGYGVTIDLVGSTFISKAGITSSTFKTVPDQPISSFELTLPQGKYSALAANGNLCKSKLAMPTEFLAQNGAKINQSTKISVTGCAKGKKTKTSKSKKKATRSGKRSKK